MNRVGEFVRDNWQALGAGVFLPLGALAGLPWVGWEAGYGNEQPSIHEMPHDIATLGCAGLGMLTLGVVCGVAYGIKEGWHRDDGDNSSPY